MSEHENRPRPFSKERTKATICKVIFFYSAFYIFMKLVAVIDGLPVLPNLILAIPYLFFAVIGFFMTRKNAYSWWYVVIGIIAISAIRYYELEWLMYLQNHFQG